MDGSDPGVLGVGQLIETQDVDVADAHPRNLPGQEVRLGDQCGHDLIKRLHPSGHPVCFNSPPRGVCVWQGRDTSAPPPSF